MSLSACATAPAAPPVAQTSVTTSRGGGAAGLLARAGQIDAPSLEQVEALLGPADIARRDGAGAMLTYRLDGCALALIFAADTRNVMRLREAQPGVRRLGDPQPSIDACAAEAEQRRRVS